MTDQEIIKALGRFDCRKNKARKCRGAYHEAKAEAVREFAEKLKATPLRFRVDHIRLINEPPESKMVLFVDDSDIDNLVEEMAGTRPNTEPPKKRRKRGRILRGTSRQRRRPTVLMKWNFERRGFE